MKGIILAGGSGTRLYPITKVISKQLIPVYDKPMIYYPLSTLMEAGIKDILIITTPQDVLLFQNLLGDGQQWGISLQYKIQEYPRGLADAFILGEKFIGQDSVCLILGDNIFFGEHLEEKLLAASNLKSGAIVFGYEVSTPQRFGVIEFDEHFNAISIEEKPLNPKSNYAATGLYFYDNQVIELAKKVQPSARGEIEITDINNMYLEKGLLKVELLDKRFSWLDTGTVESLLEASQLIRLEQQQTSKVIACLEEIALKKGWLADLSEFQENYSSVYYEYLKTLK